MRKIGDCLFAIYINLGSILQVTSFGVTLAISLSVFPFRTTSVFAIPYNLNTASDKSFNAKTKAFRALKKNL
ncbi:MAG: hypothetical protein U9R54_00900 [Bacteroidota bacterium]|nr:hypothetical protein [Bacteroidota bacterium]